MFDDLKKLYDLVQDVLNEKDAWLKVMKGIEAAKTAAEVLLKVFNALHPNSPPVMAGPVVDPVGSLKAVIDRGAEASIDYAKLLFILKALLKILV